MAISEIKYKEIAPPPRWTEFRSEFGVIGRSEKMRQIFETIEQVAPTDIPVLIYGESGTGKELIAHAIHAKSRRKARPLVIVNCGAIPEGILESELFGHERGAFTGAIAARKGYFEMADGSTVFLDEIAEMPLGTQVKLLRVLEGREFMKVGGTESIQVDVRLIAATNKELEREVQKGNFREDLYYRLNAVSIRVPPLRERKEDIRELVNHFAANFCKANHIEFEGFTEGAYRLLEDYPWPGNVRELKNVTESMIVLEKGGKITEGIVPKYLSKFFEMDRHLPVRVPRTSEEADRELIYRALIDLKAEIGQLRELIFQRVFPPKRLKPWPAEESEVYTGVLQADEKNTYPVEDNSFEGMSLEDMEKELIRRTLEKVGGNKRKAASILKISERTLYRKIKEYNLPF